MCATSIGSTRSQSPVPGERKSRIPDGTEMPAPVSATTESAPAMRRASSAVAEDSLAGVPIASAAGEARGAFGQEGRDALPRVGARERLGEGLLLGLDSRVEVARARHALDLRAREPRLGGKLARPGERRVEQFVVFGDAVGVVEPAGFVW